MPQARNDGLYFARFGIFADGCDQSRADQPPFCPCPVAYKINATGYGLQAVMTDFKPNAQKVVSDFFKPLQAGLPVWRKHNAVIHIAPIMTNF